MTSLTSDTAVRQPRPHIALGDGDTLEPRREFARNRLGVSDKTVARMNLPTTYIGNRAYVLVNASMRIIAERVHRRNKPPRRRPGTVMRAPPKSDGSRG